MSVDKPTILVVDDDVNVARMERVHLEKAGYHVVMADSAHAALARAKEGGIDLALVDLCLGESVSGLELVNQFQAAGLSLPVIIVTGYSEERTIISALRAGVCDFVPKTQAYLDYLPEATARVLRQVQTEKKLIESEARFQSFMDNGPGLCFIKDEQGKFLFVNSQLIEMFGGKQWIGRTVFDLLTPELAQRIHDDDMEAIRTGRSVERRYQGEDGDGVMQVWVTHRFPMRDRYDNILLGGVSLDVSEAARAEEALRSSEAKFRSVSESATDAIISTDQYGHVTSWNSAATKMFGYSQEEMIGQPIEQIMPRRYRMTHRQVLTKMLAEGTSKLSGQPIIAYGLRRNGDEFPIELSVGSWSDSEEIFFSGIIRDVTDRKRAEEELHRRDEQLRHSQKLEALGTLAGGVAHEFNNILQSIQGYTQYARDGMAGDDPRRQDLELVLKATDRATTLTRQLLGFSRRQMLQYTDLNPNQIVQDATRMLQPLIGEHIRLELSLGENIGTVYADPTHLQQLLMNLAVNARDAMPNGGQLLIKTERFVLGKSNNVTYPELLPGAYFSLTVSDTGCGMSSEVIRHAFDPFFTTKEVGKGTGLGLASVYGVVTQHRGAIRVYSEPKIGTSFKILLPLVERPAEIVQTMTPSFPRAVGNETILVAEDEPLVRDLAIRVLEHAGYKTISASDGLDALETFRKHQAEVSLVMLDVVMPRMNGHEVYQRMRLLSPSVKVVFSSAYDLETAQLGFICDHGLRFVQKPCDAVVLLQAIRDVLDSPPIDVTEMPQIGGGI